MGKRKKFGDAGVTLKTKAADLTKARAFRLFIAGATGPMTVYFEATAAPAELMILNDTLDVRRVESSSDGKEFATVFERTPPKIKPPSRVERWNAAASDAREALETLQAIQDEYEEWRDNMSENLHGSSTYEKLDTVCDFDIDGALDTINEVEGADLPVGFGRD